MSIKLRLQSRLKIQSILIKCTILKIGIILLLTINVNAQIQDTDDFWDDQFYLPGITRAAHTVVASGNMIYVGGEFDVAGNVTANNVAVWNGEEWQQLGSGTNGEVLTLLHADGNLYAAGDFTEAGGVPANNIARWDGENWHALGGGLTGGSVSGTVQALAHHDGKIYAGGTFTNADGEAANRIAVWDNESWSEVGGGVSNGIQAIAVTEEGIYVAGSFFTAGDLSGRIAFWDGDEWHPLGSGLNSDAESLIALGDDLFAAGFFTQAGGVSVNQIARWDGEEWHPLDDRMNWVTSLHSHNETLIAAGQLQVADGPANRIYIAEWMDDEWHPVGSYFGTAGVFPFPRISSISSNDTGLITAGSISQNDGTFLRNISIFQDDAWQPLGAWGKGIPGFVFALYANDEYLYAGGDFRNAGGISANNIARWDGNDWHPIGNGVNGRVHAIIKEGEDVYAAGEFSMAAGSTVNKIARWDGEEWHPLGDGLKGGSIVWSLIMHNSELYAAGNFSEAGSETANNIARWDGENWHPLGGGLNGTGASLESDGENLFVSGNFTTAGEVQANRVARWDGEEWHPLGGGMDGFVSVLKINEADGYLYAGGGFSEADGNPAGRFAFWDGDNWHQVGDGLNSGIEDILNFDFGAALAGILFQPVPSSAGSKTQNSFKNNEIEFANNIVLWNFDEERFHVLGSGVNSWDFGGGFVQSIFALAEFKSDIYAGGTITIAGGKPSLGIARWTGYSDLITSAETEQLIPVNFVLAQNYPNPFNPSTVISYQLPAISDVRLEVFDIIGRRVATLVNGMVHAGVHEVHFNASHLASGVYIYRLQAGSYVQTRKLILIK